MNLRSDLLVFRFEVMSFVGKLIGGPLRSIALNRLPLVLLVRSWRIRDAWNALLVWRAEGKGLGLWPEG